MIVKQREITPFNYVPRNGNTFKSTLCFYAFGDECLHFSDSKVMIFDFDLTILLLSYISHFRFLGNIYFLQLFG